MQELIQEKKEIFTQANSKKENSMDSDITSIANLENNTLVITYKIKYCFINYLFEKRFLGRR